VGPVRWSERLLLFVASAGVLVAVDQVVKSTVNTPLWTFHHRSYGWFALSIAVLAGALLLTLVSSRAVAVAAGVMSAGVIGNLISARLNENRVPNPLVIGNYESGFAFAFNLADVFFLAGNLLLMAALVEIVVRRRDRLAAPRAWERALLRQLHVGG
jgi:Signal peptidase (SPase) II